MGRRKCSPSPTATTTSPSVLAAKFATSNFDGRPAALRVRGLRHGQEDRAAESPSRRVSNRKGTDRKSLRWLKESEPQGDRSLRLLLSTSKYGVAVLACITRRNLKKRLATMPPASKIRLSLSPLMLIPFPPELTQPVIVFL
jgi:hypothetical protein